MPLVHVPVMLGTFFGMEHLCGLPVEQFHRSGVSFLPDFLVPDPTSYAVLHLTQGTFFSRLLPARTGLPWFHTSIAGALFSRLLPARVLHQAALNLRRGVSCSFPISRFRTQHLTQYYILHRDCILYLYVKIYMIQSNKYGSVQHETGKWGSQVGKAGGRPSAEVQDQ
jgi:hypothetical protein